MPGPPPPPPPGPPPPPSFGSGLLSSSKSSDDGRNLLLDSIRQGTRLKKTSTSDRSAPLIINKHATNSSSSSPLKPGGNNNSSGMTNGGLGGLFAGGMPKLKPTGRSIGAVETDSGVSSNSSTPTPSRGANAASAGSVRRPFVGDVRNRGPPPQPPPATLKPSLTMNSPEETVAASVPKFNADTSHRNALPSLPSKPPVGGYGKPHLAPRPPPLNINNNGKPSPPPKKLFTNGTDSQNRVVVTRAQSMRVPRSPPVAPPTPPFPPSKELGRGGSGSYPSFHQSQDSLPTYHSNPPPRTATLPSNLNHHGSSKSLAPPPPAPSGNKPILRPPLCRPPPPPSRPPPPPTHAPPPPPPHKTGPAPSPLGSQTRLAPQVLGPAPPPPSRSTSIRNGDLTAGNIEARLADYFHLVHEFPKPPEFLNVTKVYNSNNVCRTWDLKHFGVKLQAATSGKQQAPQPPMIQLEKKMWASNSSNC